MASALSKSLVKKARKTAKERKSWGSEREFGDDRNGRGGSPHSRKNICWLSNG